MAENEFIEEEQDLEKTTTPVKAKNLRKKEKRKTIIVHKSSEQGAEEQITVSVNGKVYLIKRGEEVSVPESVVEVLNNAVKETYEFQGEDKPLKKIEAHTYPFSVVK